MRILTPLFALAALLMGGQVSAATLNLDFSSNTLTVGQSFTVNVIVNDPFAPPYESDVITGYGFNLNFSNVGLVLFNGFTFGPLFVDAGDGNPNVLAITADFLGIDSATPNSNPLLLGTLNFTALAPGSTTVEIASNTAVSDEGLVYLFGDKFQLAGSGTVRINDAAIPEPSTWLLFGSALLLVIAIQRFGLNRV
ncbi:MAG TPA: cohesin domain-containing protein [Bryobacteraceae bacterium]|jgi:hypothetical protein|nr:cohesin domain-containing protein [Bryobacteraceae bacterium]